MTLLTGHQLIAEERKRQIESEGWTREEDNRQGSKRLEIAAMCYRQAMNESEPLPCFWPFAPEWWKPKSRQRNLVRAGALFLAGAEVAESRHDMQHRDMLQGHAYCCALLINSLNKTPS